MKAINDNSTGFLKPVLEVEPESELILARRKAERGAALLEIVSEAISVITLDGSITYCNSAFERLYGVNRQQALKMSVHSIMDIDVEKPDFQSILELLSVSNECVTEMEIESGNRKVLTDTKWTMMLDEKGQPVSILRVDTDITVRKKEQAQVLRGQRLQTIGTLSGGIAHHLNNLLMPILMAAGRLAENPNEDVSRTAKLIKSKTETAAALIKQLWGIAQSKKTPKTQTAPKSFVEMIKPVIEATTGDRITFSVELAPTLPDLQCNPQQVHQALLNICLNAVDAMPESGSLSFTVSSVVIPNGFSTYLGDARPGSFICFEIRDTGHGISPSSLERIFEPFYTTKKMDKGDGLGLAVTLKIIKAHGGFIDVSSVENVGTRFAVYLPL